MQKIQFINHKRNPGLRSKRSLKVFILELFAKERKKIKKITYIFCSDKQIININKTFLKHNYYTDIISFDLSQLPEEIEAEIYISIDRVKDNASKEGASFNEELHRVIFHGALHFCGYNDKKREEAKEMRKKENLYLNKYFE